MQTAAAVESGCPDFVNIGSSIKKAFCPKEETSPSSFIKGQAESAHKRVDRMIALGTAVLEVTRPAFRAEPVVKRDSLRSVDLPVPFSPVKKQMRERSSVPRNSGLQEPGMGSLPSSPLGCARV